MVVFGLILCSQRSQSLLENEADGHESTYANLVLCASYRRKYQQIEAFSLHRIHSLLFNFTSDWSDIKYSSLLEHCGYRFQWFITRIISNCRHLGRNLYDWCCNADGKQNITVFRYFGRNLWRKYESVYKISVSRWLCNNILYSNLDANNEYFRYFQQANDKSERLWNFYFKLVVAGYPAITFSLAAVLVVLCRVTNKGFDIDYLYMPYKLRWVNQNRMTSFFATWF